MSSSRLTGSRTNLPRLIRAIFVAYSLLHDLRRIFNYLGLIGRRLRDPADCGGVSFQTIDCKASSFVFGYALYLSCVSLRRNATRSPRDVFESTHKVILSALAQAVALCDRVYPVEVTSLLRQSIHREFELAQHGERRRISFFSTISSYLKWGQVGCLFGHSTNSTSTQTPCWCCNHRKRRMERVQLLFVAFFVGSKSTLTMVAGCPVFDTWLSKQNRGSLFKVYCRSARCLVSDRSSHPRGPYSNQNYYFGSCSPLNLI